MVMSGRRAKTSAIQFCLSIKVLFKLPLRQTAGMVASLLRLAGLDWPDLAPISPNTQAVAFWAAMNSRGERHFSPECGWFSL